MFDERLSLNCRLSLLLAVGNHNPMRKFGTCKIVSRLGSYASGWGNLLLA